MCYLTDICFLCLENNIKVQSVLIEDTDGIVVNEKLRCFFPEIIDSTPDENKFACSECLKKLRISYDFKQSVICNNTIFRDYIDKLQCQHECHQQLLVILARSKRRAIFPVTRNFSTENVEKCEEKYNYNNLEIQNECLNLTCTNQEHDQSCQLTSKENVANLTKLNCQTKETNLKIENIEIDDTLTEIHIKQERLVDDDFSSNNLDDQQKTHDQSYQPTTTENVAFTKPSCKLKEIELKTENIEIACPVPEEIYIKQEPLVDDEFRSNYSNEESKESADSNSVSNDSECSNQLKEEGAKNKLYKCSECHKVFPYRSNLTAHTRMHSGEKPYQCQICHKTFTQAVNLNTHKLTHSGDKPHQCNICHKMFNLKGNLIRHQRSHDNIRPYQCLVCNKMFPGTDNLTKHMRTHTGETPYQCHICQFKCSDASGLKRHIRSHTGEKPYQCSVCNKTFTQSCSLTRHMRSHTGKTPYQCTHCKKSFTRSNNLNLHLQKSHTSSTDS